MRTTPTMKEHIINIVVHVQSFLSLKAVTIYQTITKCLGDPSISNSALESDDLYDIWTFSSCGYFVFYNETRLA